MNCVFGGEDQNRAALVWLGKAEQERWDANASGCTTRHDWVLWFYGEEEDEAEEEQGENWLLWL